MTEMSDYARFVIAILRSGLCPAVLCATPCGERFSVAWSLWDGRLIETNSATNEH
jgi:hypothetical protein